MLDLIVSALVVVLVAVPVIAVLAHIALPTALTVIRILSEVSTMNKLFNTAGLHPHIPAQHIGG